ncbi:PaaI family thioesterase [Mycolicibacterium sp. P9-22]|uniref:PaaI family thioesterase n=1 Tax=Mycolicibacterium sp. P9-22 TaxID=2024613 RepID=UPI0018842ADC|nr:hotdog fold thioesterase [Mycolicibacterium sp. P9-22]
MGATLEEHLGIAYTTGDEGFIARLTRPEEWTNDFGILHGGIWACLAEAAAARAIGRVNGDLSTAHLHISYLRPGKPSAGINLAPNIFHVGKRCALTEVRGFSDDGTLCTVATITSRNIQPAFEQKRSHR